MSDSKNRITMNEIAEKAVRKAIGIKGDDKEMVNLKEFEVGVNSECSNNDDNKKKSYAVDYIKFIDFMKVHNFRDSHNSSNSNDLDNDTKVIRIMYGEIIDGNPFRDKDTWFEFGIYDFGSTRKFVESLNMIFSKDILNSYVCSFCVDEDTGILNVWITKEEGDEFDD